MTFIGRPRNSLSNSKGSRPSNSARRVHGPAALTRIMVSKKTSKQEEVRPTPKEE
jgi:hypothetical protein